jgi:SAM-dependent methyltransferase/predicted acetyltransferase
MKKVQTEVYFETKKASDLKENELKGCSELFSSNYGKYSEHDPEGRQGNMVRLSPSYYSTHYSSEEHFFALAKVDKEIIAHAIYLRKVIDGKAITWVLQLVVNKKYMEKGIGTKLLHSIWGFSIDLAWGLASTNPLTVKTLESATFRKVLPSETKKIGSSVHFVKKYEVSDDSSMVFTDFYVDNKGVEEYIKRAFGDRWKLGSLKPGYEWLAFTFGGQPIDSKEEYVKLLRFSENQLREAYGRMDTYNQPWAKGTPNEIDYIKKTLKKLKIDPIYAMDLGCGRGRHTVALAAEFEKLNIIGIDFSEFNIDEAKKNVVGDRVRFVCSDCRNMIGTEDKDLILALYDVIGSFPEEEENDLIIKNAYDCLAGGGCLILSVMNMELTEHLALPENVGRVNDSPEMIFNLKPSDIMQRSGDIFNPEYFAIDTDTGLVYRKEQFHGDGMLSAEYVIRDKRYKMSEMAGILERKGFVIEECRYVQAGRWDVPLESTDSKAKEILIVATKPKR